MNKRRKKLIVFLLIIVTIGCIFLGINTRKKNGIIVTQLCGEGDGYIFETSNGNLIIFDGGTKEDATRIREIIKEKGNPTVSAWFLSTPASDKSGAICEILNDIQDINIETIYSNFVSYGEWYEQFLKEDDLQEIYDVLNCLYSEKNRDKLRIAERRVYNKFDNLYVTALEVKDEEIFEPEILANQTTIYKVDNTFKSVLLLGDIAEEKARFFKENDQDQYDCDYLQISGNTMGKAGKELFEVLKPKNVLISNDKIPDYIETAENIYTKADGELTIKIW